MNDHREAVASIAAALNDPERSRIGDPRRGQYKVSLVSTETSEAMHLAQQLASLGLIPTTTLKHDEFGIATEASVNLYAVSDQRTLLDVLGDELSPQRRQVLEGLVLAREPIPDALLERIERAHTNRRVSPREIADRLNEEGVITGMGGIRWTPQKVKKALAGYEQQQSEAA